MTRLSKPIPDTSVKPSTGITLCDAIMLWQAEKVAANLSPRTIEQYAYALRVVCDHMGDVSLTGLTRERITGLIADLFRRGWKATSVSTIHRPLRTFCRWAVKRGYLATSPIEDLPVVVPFEPPKFPTPADLSKVLATCAIRSPHAFRARRDAAIIRIMASTGLRLAEVAGMTLQDVRLEAVATITVLGKGRKVRAVPLDEPTRDALVAYLSRERPRSSFAGTDAVWLAPRGPMTASGIFQMVQGRGVAAGVPLHPHSLRHYAADSMLRSGMSEGDVMQIGGWSTRSMLSRYGSALASERAQAAFLRAERVAL